MHTTTPPTVVKLAAAHPESHFSLGAIAPLALAEAIVGQSENLLAGKPVVLVVPPLEQEVNFMGRTFDATESITITLTQKT